MDRAVDLLHPLTSLEWRECRRPPVEVAKAQSVWLNDKVYVGGGDTPGSIRADARLYIYVPTTDIWTTLNTPTYHFALTTYHSQPVLVGGWEYTSDLPTNRLWTLSENDQWQETLPPMPTPCGTDVSAVSHGDHLLVINCDQEKHNNKAYVYNGHHWASVQYPTQHTFTYDIKSILYDGCWYIMRTVPSSQRKEVYSASLDSLLASHYELSETETLHPSSVWKKLTDISSRDCYPAVFGNRLVAVTAGRDSHFTTTSVYAYSSATESWVHVGDAAESMWSYAPYAVVLPSTELMIVRGRKAFKVIIKMTPFDLGNLFSINTLSSLEAAAGIPVRNILTSYTQSIQMILGLTTIEFPNIDLKYLLEYWLKNAGFIAPTWKNLLLIIRLLNLDELAQRMETYLSGGTEELSSERRQEWQEMARMRKVIEDLKQKNEELQRQLLLARFRENAMALTPVKTATYPRITFTIEPPAEAGLNLQSGIKRSQTFGDITNAGAPSDKKGRLEDDESASRSSHSTTSVRKQDHSPPIPVKPELKDLIKELLAEASDKWENIGILLGIEPGRLDAIKAAENLPQNCLREMLKIWLKRVLPPPSWSAIAEAIDLLGDQSLADRLRTKYHHPPRP